MRIYVTILLAALMVGTTYAQNAKHKQPTRANGSHTILIGDTEVTYNLHNGKLNGPFKKSDNNSTSTSGFFINDKEHSTWTSYHPNGAKWAEVGFMNGNKHGMWRVWNSDGSLQYEYEYRNGIPVGTWKAFDTTGEIVAYVQK